MSNKETDKRQLYTPPVLHDKDGRDQYKCESLMEMLELFGAPTSTGECITQVDKLLHVRSLIKIHEGISRHGVCFKALRRKGYTPREAALTVFRELAARNHLFINEDAEIEAKKDPSTSLAIAMVEGLTGESGKENPLNKIRRMVLKSKLRKISEKAKVKSSTTNNKTDGDNED